MTAGGNIAAHLSARAAATPHQLAVVVPAGRGPSGRARYAHLTYAQLEAEATALAQGFTARGMAPGTRVAVMVPPSLPFFAVTFALFRAGLVPVFIDPGMGLSSLKRCLAEAAPTAFIGTPKAHLARVLFGWCRQQLAWTVHVGPGAALFGGTPLASCRSANHGYIAAQAAGAAGAPAAILFTSGSTGSPKGAVYEHATFAAQIAALQQLFRIAPGEVDLCTFPLFALFAPALGMTAVVPAMDFTRPAQVVPDRLFTAIDDFGVTNLFGSPALLRAVAKVGSQRQVVLPSLRRVVSAGAPVGPRIIAAFTQLLRPGVEVFTPYGATEALPVACIGSAEILQETAAAAAAGHGLCVGRAAPGIDLAVMPIMEGPVATWDERLRLEPGCIGEVVVRGPQVTARYHARPEADAAAKIRDGDHVRHRMGDLGYLDAHGRLWYCGRKTQRLETTAGPLYTDACEGVFNAHRAVHRTALVGRGARGAMTPVLCVESEARLAKAEQQRLAGELLELAKGQRQTAQIRELRFFRALPVDRRHNAKIFRERLKAVVDREARP